MAPRASGGRTPRARRRPAAAPPPSASRAGRRAGRRASPPCRGRAAPGRSRRPWARVSATRPSIVGTSTLPPRTASSRVIGSSTRMSSPSRVKKSCGSTPTVTSASPAGPPPMPSPPLPRRRIVWPSARPARDLHVEHLPVRQGDPPGRAPRRLEEAHLQRVVPVRAAHLHALAARAPPAAGPLRRRGRRRRPTCRRSPRSRGGCGRSPPAPRRTRGRTCAPAAPAPRRRSRRRSKRAPLLRVLQQVVGRRRRLEPIRRLGVARVEVGWLSLAIFL